MLESETSFKLLCGQGPIMHFPEGVGVCDVHTYVGHVHHHVDGGDIGRHVPPQGFVVQGHGEEPSLAYVGYGVIDGLQDRPLFGGGHIFLVCSVSILFP